MRTRGGMLLANGLQGFFREMPCQPNKRRPQTAVDIGNFTVDQPANENIFTVPYHAGSSKNLLTVGMRPPVSVNWSFGYSLRQIWNGPLGTFQDHAMLTNKANSVDVHGNGAPTHA